jgi:hypothetical protein
VRNQNTNHYTSSRSYASKGNTHYGHWLAHCHILPEPFKNGKLTIENFKSQNIQYNKENGFKVKMRVQTDDNVHEMHTVSAVVTPVKSKYKYAA